MNLERDKLDNTRVLNHILMTLNFILSTMGSHQRIMRVTK